jgi:3-oxoacyl-[acyl-carrier protein] reductase
MGQLDGKVVVVTGASSGIGAATAEALVNAGALVVLGARRGERLDEMVGRLGPDHALAVVTDVKVPADSKRLVARATERFGHLDAFVANAGIGIYGSVLDNSDDDLANMIDVNYAGTVWGVRAAVPAILDNGGGDVVIVASVAGLRGGANEAVYAGTKFAQVGFAGAIDREFREKGVRVSTICPAAVDTEFALGTGRTAGDPWLKDVLRGEDVAHAVVTVLAPRHVHTTQWAMWAMSEPS